MDDQRAIPLDAYELSDRYSRDEGRVFLTGTQALVRIPLMQRALDRAAGLNTAGFISGYRGSPLGSYDLELWRAKTELDANDIEFTPAINEDLGATMVLGTQQVETNPHRTVDGVFSIWYGKGPGVDRSGDALKHGNAYGSSPRGGVLVVAGDDHGCVSSSMPHQSDVAFMSWFMPTLNPANVAEYLSYGLYGFALSRFSGMWVGFKAVSETVESGASVILPPAPNFVTPDDFTPPAGGLHYRWPDFPGPQIEERMEAKVAAVAAFARANPIDRKILDIPNARFGIITTGKGHYDLLEALRLLGITEARARNLGIDIYKVGMVWPLQKAEIAKFLTGKREVLVVEEKRGIIESEMKEHFYDTPGDKPGLMVGKYDENGATLVPWTGELSPLLLAPIVAARLERVFEGLDLSGPLNRLMETGMTAKDPGNVARRPYFCSGCPHNTSTKVPEGSTALAGIGCHFMASWMDRKTESLIQMGGEGINWAGMSKFIGNQHVFQNLGEGTYFHSGSMAIRQAIAAGTNITYKILFNDAVAMTGGQPVDGTITVPAIAHQVRSEGVERIAILSDEPEKYSDKSIFPPDVTFHHRDDLDPIQREMRETPGVTVLIYDQTCAAEKRRRRKRGTFPDPAKRVFINDLVCEGCGDCSVQSNCLSVVPKETAFGRKRQIDQSSCNKDFSCVKGFCPSFVTVEGGTLKKGAGLEADAALQAKFDTLQNRAHVAIDGTFDLLVGGVGGTGVVTVGAVITMAAHLEEKGATVLDFTGFAQKGGTVLSYIRLAEHPDLIHQVRVDTGRADAMIACDLVVGTSDRALGALRGGTSHVVVNTAEQPTADYVLNRNADMHAAARVGLLRTAVGSDLVDTLDAQQLGLRLMGDTVFANMILFGFAWQAGSVPVSLDAITRAIELNGVAIDKNKLAFNWGRLAFTDVDAVNEAAGISENPIPETLDEKIARRVAFLTDYQNAEYANRYAAHVQRVRDAEHGLGLGELALTDAVARNLFKLMAYKDEYEVARLYAETGMLEDIRNRMDGKVKFRFHLAPPTLGGGLDAQGRPKKKQFGGWMLPAFKVLAKLRGLRGTAFDPFGRTTERRSERQLIEDYIRDLNTLLEPLNADRLETIIALAEIPDLIRGYGPVKETAIEEAAVERERLFALLDDPVNAEAA